MNYIQLGKGKPIVLLHGLADTCHDWDAILPGLSEAGFCTYAPDLPGHGDSPRAKHPSDYTINNLMASLESWIDSLDLIQPAYLVGHSLGGYLCLEFARRHPDACQRLVLLDPFYTPRQLSPVIYNLLRRTTLTEKALHYAPTSLLTGALRLTPLIQAPIPPHHCRQKAQDFKRADPAVMRIPASMMDLSTVLATIQIPTYVIWGKNDITLNTTLFSELVSSLPFASGKALEHTGHQPHIQCPEIVLQLILEFLL